MRDSLEDRLEMLSKLDAGHPHACGLPGVLRTREMPLLLRCTIIGEENAPRRDEQWCQRQDRRLLERFERSGRRFA
jgi:hypothetical protein